MYLYRLWFFRQTSPTYSDWQLADRCNNKLRKLFSKWSKYREKSLISWVKAKSSIIEGFNDCVDKWCSEHGMD